jgi:hypothetical protein
VPDLLVEPLAELVETLAGFGGKRCQALCMIPFPFPEEQYRVLEAVLGMKS